MCIYLDAALGFGLLSFLLSTTRLNWQVACGINDSWDQELKKEIFPSVNSLEKPERNPSESKYYGPMQFSLLNKLSAIVIPFIYVCTYESNLLLLLSRPITLYSYPDEHVFSNIILLFRMHADRIHGLVNYDAF